MIDLETEIEEGHGGCVCPLCDDAVLKHDAHVVVIAHGCKYIVHDACVALLEQEDEDDEEDEDDG